MKTIRQLKTDSQIFTNLDPKSADENGNEIWNIPENIDEFKALVVDTIKWEIGSSVKKTVGNSTTNMSASNAKAVALVAKLIKPTDAQLNKLTDLEKDSWNKIKALADSGYADSQMLNASLTSVSENIAAGTDRIVRVMQAGTHEDVIEILNEE